LVRFNFQKLWWKFIRTLISEFVAGEFICHVGVAISNCYPLMNVRFLCKAHNQRRKIHLYLYIILWWLFFVEILFYDLIYILCVSLEKNIEINLNICFDKFIYLFFFDNLYTHFKSIIYNLYKKTNSCVLLYNKKNNFCPFIFKTKFCFNCPFLLFCKMEIYVQQKTLLWKTGRLFAVYKIYSQDLVSQECQVGNFIPRNKYEIVFG
jgi:hypothetical protein